MRGVSTKAIQVIALAKERTSYLYGRETLQEWQEVTTYEEKTRRSRTFSDPAVGDDRCVCCEHAVFACVRWDD